MSIDFGGWLSGEGSVAQAQFPLRAQLTERRINDKPVDVAFLRNGEKLDPQTIRIEFENSVLNNDSEIGTSTLRRGTILGVRGHPTLDDLDVDEWDTFVFDDNEFTITFVNRNLIGEIQAEFEAV